MTARPVRIRFADLETETIHQLPIPQRLGERLANFGAILCRKLISCCERSQCRSCLNVLSSVLRNEHVTEKFLKSEEISPEQMIERSIQPMLEKYLDTDSAALLFIVLNAVDCSIRSFFKYKCSFSGLIGFMATNNSRAGIHCESLRNT